MLTCDNGFVSTQQGENYLIVDEAPVKGFMDLGYHVHFGSTGTVKFTFEQREHLNFKVVAHSIPRFNALAKVAVAEAAAEAARKEAMEAARKLAISNRELLLCAYAYDQGFALRAMPPELVVMIAKEIKPFVRLD